MANIRIYLFLIGLSLFLSASVIAQKSPLVITGSIVEVKVAGVLVAIPPNPNNPYEYRYQRYERTDLWFDVSVRLQYHNRGEVPLIVPTPGSFFYGRKMLLFLDIPSPDSKVSTTSDEWTYPGSRVWTPSIIKELERVEPSRYYFAIIEPGGYYETLETIRAKSGYKLDIRPSQDIRQRDLEFAIPEHAYFKIRYSLSLKDRSEGSDLLADAQRRWSRFGKLVLNSDGDFYFETDVIINKLSD